MPMADAQSPARFSSLRRLPAVVPTILRLVSFPPITRPGMPMHSGRTGKFACCSSTPASTIRRTKSPSFQEQWKASTGSELVWMSQTACSQSTILRFQTRSYAVWLRQVFVLGQRGCRSITEHSQRYSMAAVALRLTMTINESRQTSVAKPGPAVQLRAILSRCRRLGK